MGFRVEVDWAENGYDLGALTPSETLTPSSTLTPALTPASSADVTARVRARQSAVSLSYGRDQSTALAPTVAGRGSFVLDNSSRDYSPRNTASPLYGLIKPARPVTITRTFDTADENYADVYGGGSSVQFTLFIGHTDDNPINPDLNDKTVTLSLVDSLADFRGLNISTPLYSGVRTGTVIGYILDAAGWTGARDLDPGATVIPWWWEDNTDALTAMEKVLQSEGPPALLTIGADGAIVFKDRHHRILDAASLTPRAIFAGSDAVPAGTGTVSVVTAVGLSVAGGEFGTIPGTYDTDYHYDGQASLNALYALGIRHIRVPIKMERLQPTAGAAFDATEQTRIASYLGRIAAAGLTCKIEAHNYGRRSVSGTEYELGHANYTQAHHVDFYSRLAALCLSYPQVTQLGYNEPHDIPAVTGTFTPAATHYNYESTAQGWAAESGTAVRTTTSPITGTGSLLGNKTFAAGLDNLRLNDASGLADDISANGAALQLKLKARSANVGTGTQARIEVQNSSFVWQTGPWFPVTVGTGGTYGAVATLQYTPAAGLLANCRAIGIQFEGTGLNGSTDVQIDDVQQGAMVGALTGAQVWQAADAAAYTAVVAAGFTGAGREYHASGYSWSGAKDYTTINGAPWITPTTLAVRYEAHSYGDDDRSGTYGASYATETTNAAGQGYASVGARWAANISDFTSWCTTYSVNGVIGEIGWPDDAGWNAAGSTALNAAVVAGFQATYWAVGEWWGTGYALSPWEWTGTTYAANGQAAFLFPSVESVVTLTPVLMNKPFSYDEAWRNIVNTGTVEIGIRQGKDPEAVWTSDATITLAAGEIRSITASTSDPFFNAETPVVGTDYTVASGTPTVILSAVNGSSATIQITAAGGVPAIIEGLQLRAQPVSVSYSVQVSQSNSQSITDYGSRSFPNDLSWCNQYDAEAVLQTAIAQRAQPNPVLNIRFLVGDNVPRGAAVLARDLSDRVTVVETETAIDDDFYIESIQHDFSSEPDHSVTFGLEMVPAEAAVPEDTSFRFNDTDHGFNEGTFSTGLVFTGSLFKFDDADKGFDEGGWAY